jgi:hypothetical protein
MREGEVAMIASLKWQHWANFLLGGWLAMSPWVLGFAEHERATMNAVAFGVVLIVFSLLELQLPEVWEEWVNMFSGLWLVVAPFALGFTADFDASANTMLVGAVAAMLAAWAMSLDKEIGKWWHDHVTGH